MKPNRKAVVESFVFSAILKNLNFNGARMIFPYVTEGSKGEAVRKYACIDGADLFSIVKWDVDASGSKLKIKKTTKKVTKKRK